jgi:GWxTD domain-containing protein
LIIRREFCGSFRRFNISWDLFSFKDRTFEEILEQMRSIASRDELKQLSKLAEADRQRGLLEFWQRHDPTPGTLENEVMNEFYRRVAHANRHFKWRSGEGWRSPQGQIYIKHGPPDEVRRYVDSPAPNFNDTSRNRLGRRIYRKRSIGA